LSDPTWPAFGQLADLADRRTKRPLFGDEDGRRTSEYTP
jgi:hypothetical protein